MPWPEEYADTVLYGEREFIGDKDLTLRMVDGARTDIIGDVYVNGEKISEKGSVVLVRDYVKKNEVDPTAVTAGIRSAITAAGVDGTLIFDPRQYLVTGTFDYADIFLPLSGQTWVGNGARIEALGTYLGSKQLHIYGVNNVTVSGFTFTCPNVTASLAIQLTSCDGVNIHHNRFFNPKSGGVHGKGDVTNLRVTDNYFRGIGYGVIMNNPQAPLAVEVTGSYNWMISNNTMDGLGQVGDAIELNRPTASAKGVIVSGNIIRNYTKGAQENVGFGIALANIGDAVVSGNFITNCDRNGIHVEDGEGTFITITGNTCLNCKHAGIEVQTSITIGSPNSITISGNVVRGCCIAPTVNLGKGGIEVNFVTADTAATSQVIISNNISSANNAGHGIHCYQVSYCIVTGNICNDSNGGVGILLHSSTYSSLMGNICTDTRSSGKTQTHGLRLTGSATGMLYGPNILHNNLTGTRDITGSGQEFINIGEMTTTTRVNFGWPTNNLAFFNGTGAVKTAVSGSRAANAALASLLSTLATYGLITDSSTA